MSHTPGPWKRNYRRITPVGGPSDGTGDICHVYGDETIETMNANLIAASPDLLRACKDVLAALEKATQETGEILWLDHVLPGVHESAMERLQNVIDDAEGRSKTCLDCGEKFVGPTELCDACLDERDGIDEIEKTRG